jgi:hypothetical protein
MKWLVFVCISNRISEVFKWIEIIVMKNMSVLFVDYPYTCSITQLKNISAKTLRSHILELPSFNPG